MTAQKTCFIIQPLSDEYKKRCDDTYKPAIRSAGLVPYRVDEHYEGSKKLIIDNIEEQIRRSLVCLADISEDNPNVWYEVGFAEGQNKSVILICEKQARESLPFDMNQRNVYFYDLTLLDDWEELLKKEITHRLKKDISSVSNIEDKLFESELQRKDALNIPKTLNNCQVDVLGCVLDYEKNVNYYEKASVKNIHGSLRPDYVQGEINLALHTLVRWGFVEQFGENSDIFETTDRAITWCEDNYALLFPKEIDDEREYDDFQL